MGGIISLAVPYNPNPCPPDPANYVHHAFSSFFMNLIPFIGPSLDSGLTPKPPNDSAKLQSLQATLTANTLAWETVITNEVIKTDTELNELVKTIVGTGNNDDYATITANYVLEPVAERTTINTINIVFLGILLSIVILYLLLNKKYQ